jgi:hypothetical protein
MADTIDVDTAHLVVLESGWAVVGTNKLGIPWKP